MTKRPQKKRPKKYAKWKQPAFRRERRPRPMPTAPKPEADKKLH